MFSKFPEATGDGQDAAHTVSSGAAATTDPLQARTTRVLRWVFHRRDEELVCEICITTGSRILLMTSPPWNPTRPVEVFGSGLSALRRQAAIEQVLFDAGWSLDSFSSAPRRTRSVERRGSASAHAPRDTPLR